MAVAAGLNAIMAAANNKDNWRIYSDDENDDDQHDIIIVLFLIMMTNSNWVRGEKRMCRSVNY